MELHKRDNVALKCDNGEVAKGWISGIEDYEVAVPVELPDGGDGYVDSLGQIFTVTFHQDKFNEQTSTNLIGREFYRQALINAMEAAQQ